MNVIVVGVDGSAAALAATRVAAQEAARGGALLRIVHAFIWPLMHVGLGPSSLGPPEGGLRAEAERILAEAEQAGRAEAPEIRVSTRLVTGAPAPVLAAEGRFADLVVVGDRGLGGFSGLLLGSVAVHLASHSLAPVLVVRDCLVRGSLVRDSLVRGSLGGGHPGGAVLVGVDGSPESDDCVDAAFREASLREAPLVALHTWAGMIRPALGLVDPTGPPTPNEVPIFVMDAEMAELAEQAETRVLAEALAGRGERYPDVKVHMLVERGPAAQALVRHSADAQLVVVGSHGRGGFAGLLLGSVSHQVLHHAECPVLLVPHRHRHARA